ncbi:hypothetical protein VB618_16625 [Microvirga sp. CF3062]|uniref:hypothetical protein n=1 Tax=Microvirga sp. CF3062 TaxID=3110182 RepID=UPI002E767A18|nr:hypothetical protein [Microvirga sp. CF3062]MEE1657828.1 hypothetical protein [Microvirga sp. CF3062]
MEEDGQLIRLFPVPFRLIGDGKQFKKWQWISARVENARKDRRPESHNIYVDTISFDGDPLPTKYEWQARREYLDKLHIFDDFAALDNARETSGLTLGLLRPSRILGLDITPVDNPDWTDEEKQKLIQHQQQGGLFDATDSKSISMLNKLPFDFHYRYACEVDGILREYRHKIADWEAGALFWNCYYADRQNWEGAFRAKMEKALPAADLMFLMGTIHRFPSQWLIVSLIYPPKLQPHAPRQGSLFDL